MLFKRLALAVALCAAIPAHAQQPAGLEEALRSVLRLHPALRGKQAEVDASAFGGAAARSQRLPTVSATAQQYAASGGLPSSAPLTLRARQPLWAFGRIDATIASADAQQGVEQADLLRVRRQLIEQTAVGYVTVHDARRRLEVAQESIDAHQLFLDQITRRERGQLASRADVGLAATRLAQARARAQRVEGELAVAESDLLALTQVAIGTAPPVASTHTELPEAQPGIALALEASAAVAGGVAQLARAQAGIASARTAAMPTVYLQAERNQGVSGLRDGNRVGLAVEGALEGLGLAARSRTGAASAQREAALHALEAARNDVARSVRRLYAGRAMQRQLADSQRASVEDLAQLVGSYRRQYEAGSKSWLDVLNMQRELVEQRLALVQAESDWLAQTLQLKAMTGGFDALAGSNGN